MTASQSGQPPASLRRDEALAFIIERIARDGVSPSGLEIALALDVGETRAKQLVRQLIRLGRVERTPGAKRGLRVRDVASARIALEQAMRRLGWTTAEPMGELQPPCPNRQLPRSPPFRQIPDIEEPGGA